MSVVKESIPEICMVASLYILFVVIYYFTLGAIIEKKSGAKQCKVYGDTN